ncbi:MAG: hypothetical protein KGY67_02460 [Candidatus Thermoplasmatota archaeon]|nr:hypothetical protein [Candidatus Thermoplasmatota archaeon]
MIQNMDVFYGGAIQGAQNRKQRAAVHRAIINKIKEMGYNVVTEHTTGTNYAEAIQHLEEAIGPLPKEEMERRRYVRDKMINFVEGDVIATVFELSIPSLGTGIEFAHAYLRPSLGLKKIPVIGLYQKDYWPNKLSTMIRGIPIKDLNHVTIYDYTDIEDVKQYLESFFENMNEP